MADLCCNTVIITGKKENLQKLYDAYQSIRYEIKTPEELQNVLGFECEDWGRSSDCAMDYMIFREDGSLEIDCCTAWSSIPKYWNALCEFMNLKWRSYSYVNTKHWTENDRNGNFFSWKYILDIDETAPAYMTSITGKFFIETSGELVRLLENFDHSFSIPSWIDILKSDRCEWANLSEVKRY